MTPVYDLNSPPSPFPFLELKEDQHLQFFIPPHQASSSLASQIFFNIPQDESATGPREQKKHHHKADKYILHGGSRDDHRGIASSSSSSQPTIDCAEYSGELSTVRELKDENRRENEPAKWMPLKMRVMRKMINDSCDKQEITVMHKFCDQQGDNSETSCPTYNCGNLMRACSDCNTTKTPLWRSGPQGPKSLCNACGIRQRKARRAMAAAANGMVIATDNSTTRKYKVQNKGKKSRSSFTAQYKKPFKLPGSCSQSGGKSSFEDFAMSLSKKLTIGQAFPKDEKEAAILLMALSCGLLHG